MDIHPVVLDGRVARLEPLGEQHAESLAAIATPELFAYHFPPPDFTPDGFRALIAFVTGMPGWCPFAIVKRDEGRAVGVTSYLDIRPHDRALEIGFTWLAKSLHGSAMNPECKYLLLRNVFESERAVRVQLKTDLRNLQSQRALEKLGALREGILRKQMIMPDGYIRDTVMYSIIDDEWPTIRAQLEARLGYRP